jgi:hypothetical protein
MLIASLRGLPVSLMTTSMMSSWRATNWSTRRQRTSARSSKERVAHSACALRARATAACTSSAVAHSNCPIDSSVTGLFTL